MMLSSDMRAFEFRRDDGVVYRTEPVPGDNRWKRTDLDLWCVCCAGTGGRSRTRRVSA
jgi:hypothetical protein